MAQRKVIWTETAARLRREILNYWTERNGSSRYAQKLILLTNSRIKLIVKNPKIYKKADFLDTRVAAMGHFSIFYKTTDENIIVTAFWDNRQDPKKLLQILTEKTPPNRV